MPRSYGGDGQPIRIATLADDAHNLHRGLDLNYADVLPYSQVVAQQGPPTGPGVIDMQGASGLGFMGIAGGNENEEFTAVFYGWRPVPPASKGSQAISRKALYDDVLWIPRLLVHVNLTIGAMVGVDDTEDSEAINSVTLFAKSIAAVLDNTRRESLAIVNADSAAIAEGFFDCDGYPLIQCIVSRQESPSGGSASGGGSTSGETPGGGCGIVAWRM